MLACIDELRPGRACCCADQVRCGIIPAIPHTSHIPWVLHILMMKQHVQLMNNERICQVPTQAQQSAVMHVCNTLEWVMTH